VLTATMLTAIHRVHAKNGPWTTNGGYEYNLVLIAAALALAEVGPGALSLDAARGRERSGSGWALAALVTGALGAIGSYAIAAAQPAPTETGAGEAEQAASAETGAEQTEQALNIEGAS
jgi:putative oxidoreductase